MDLGGWNRVPAKEMRIPQVVLGITMLVKSSAVKRYRVLQK